MIRTFEDKGLVLVTHTSVIGAVIIGEGVPPAERSRAVRKVTVGEIRPYAQYPQAVTITFYEPRKRRLKLLQVVPDNILYVTIERNGEVVYDSRTEVACDMAAWQASRDRHAAEVSEHLAFYETPGRQP